MSEVTKAEIRRKVRAGRTQLSVAELVRRGEAIAASLERHVHPRAVVAGYVPLPGEPNVLPFLERHVARAGSVYLPVVPPKGRILRWAPWTPQTQLRQHSKLPISEPSTSSTHDVEALVVQAAAARGKCPSPLVVLVPTLALDSGGARLGQGGGYYDTTTERLTSVLQNHPGLSCELIAVVHSEEVMPPGSFPVERHDLRVSRAVTEYRVFGV